jgi:4,4'-diaponeurosporenoate glycosyltransferase
MTEVLVVSLAARWLAGWYLGGRQTTLAAVTRGINQRARAKASVSVVIPARNEERSLPALLRSLRVQSAPPLEIIVVDDHSSDGTREVAARAGALVLTSKELPSRWLGKPWACAQGAAVASGDILVFLDADTVAGEDLLASLVAAIERARGLVSVAPYHYTERCYESGSALFNLVAMMGVGATSLNQRARVTGAFGPCIAMRVPDYAAVGGHRAVRNEVLDDVMLARACAQQGIPVLNVAGGNDLRYRMYPEGAAQLVEGWSKNFAAGAGGTPVVRLAAIVAWISGLIEAGLMAVFSWPHALFYALYAVQLKIMLRRIGNFSNIAWLHPVAALTFVAICLRSALLHARGTVKWKGRAIAVHAHPHGDD